MIRRIGVVAAVTGLVVLTTAGPAAAKGADQATITGPGISTPIVVGGVGEPGSGERLGQLGDASGLFVAMFGPASNGAMALSGTAPTGALGPRYELKYRVPGGNPGPDTLKQDAYPLAAGGPVTFTAAGQPVLGTKTTGGWYRAPDTFRPLLTSLGVPGLSAAAAIPSHAQPTSTGNAPDAANAADTANAGTAPAADHGTRWLVIAAGATGVCGAVLAVALLRRSSRPRVTSVR
jgi:hypothetical protein